MSVTDTADNIARLDTLATKGPWTFEAFNEILAGEDTCDAMLLGGDGETIVAQCLAERDWPLIVALRNSLPEIIAALRLAETSSVTGSTGVASALADRVETSAAEPSPEVAGLVERLGVVCGHAGGEAYTALRKAATTLTAIDRRVKEAEAENARLREALSFLVEGLPERPNAVGFYDIGAVSRQVVDDARAALGGSDDQA